MKTIKKVYITIYVLALSCLLSCQKQLDTKPDVRLVVPTELKDIQALLDNYVNINNRDIGSLETSADSYYVTDADYLAFAEQIRNMYAWKNENIFTIGTIPSNNDWYLLYEVINIANNCIDGLSKIDRTPKNAKEWDNIMGQALCLRAKSFLSAAFVWSLAYDDNTAATDPGIVLRLSSDFNIPSARASVKQTYEQVIRDFKEAIRLLDVNQLSVSRFSKPAAYGLLARTYLSMRNYPAAGLYADSCLKLKSTLIDYNTFNAALTFPFAKFNAEVLFGQCLTLTAALNMSRAKIDSSFYRSYADNDLRKTLFFRNNNNGSYAFKGSYDESDKPFAGIATDEVYLMRAECYARAGNISAAMTDLNTLLAKRIKTGTFSAITATNPDDALNKVLTERKKELVFRNVRWMDIKRLNKEGANISLKRIISNETIVLPANSRRFALPLPEEIIRLTGMPQNQY
ncbi:RagB/SusD family nutrient uptake outer membrane protein [Sediminibacterium ginsengisoli]|uniref:SusD family protein n=1 Tax=Sediminibacterium ginsengisoli TaxID=413434 RepID=A0A1T4MH84_9BACT|nr:RagB/SusD family nutrient uptake outer membrane protein [Sediminibacterium ginsengisoli]SJZ66138.1 SusD family protein [Sediminibacterium ginsengisoli]